MLGKVSFAKILLIFMLSMACMLAAGCKNAELPEGFSREEITEANEQVIKDLGNGNYQAVFNKMDAEMQAALPVDALKSGFDPIYSQTGEFKKIRSTAMQAMDDETYGEYVTVVTAVEYEKATTTYTISFNKELKLIGLFLK